MRIFDCFIFNNELDLLKLRLNELFNLVDYFVIVESTHTFQGNVKPLHLKEHWSSLEQFKDKIIHVIVDDMPNNGNAWHNEHHQRNCILRGLTKATDFDLIIISDCDEIIRPSIINDMRNNPRDIYGLRVPYFNFKFNYLLINHWESYHVWMTAGRKHLIQSPEKFRSNRMQLNSLNFNADNGRTKIYEHAGWHFTYLGNNDFIRNKLQSFAHTELNKQEILQQIDVETMISKNLGFNPLDPRKFTAVKLDNYFPETLIKNKIEYSKYILDYALQPAINFLPRQI